MTAVVPIFSDPDWREHPGAELASMPGEDDIESGDNPIIGLAFDATTGRYVSPRADAIRRQELKLEDLDDEELMKGRVRDADGKFRRGDSRKIPKAFHEELMRRIIERGVGKMRSNYMAAVDVIVDDVIGDDTTDIRLRYEAAKYVIERLSGKTPDRVAVALDMKPWETVMSKIIKEIPPPEIITDAEVVEDDEA